MKTIIKQFNALLMKRTARIFILLPLLFFGINNNSYSQYVQTLKDSARWYNYYSFESSINFNFQISGDKVFKGKTYKKLIGHNVHFVTNDTNYIREDTIKKRIFLIQGTTEYLLYDFSLQVSDTFHYIDPQSHKNVNLKLDSITDTLYNVLSSKVLEFKMKPKKVFYFHDLNPSTAGGNIIWVEGIGSLAGTLWPDGNIAGSTILLCHYNEKEVEDYHTIRDYEPQPCEGPLLCVKDFDMANKMNIYPNPVSSLINISFPAMLSGKVSIINNLGRELKSVYFSNELTFQLDLIDIKSGIYFIKVISDNRVYIEKIIINNYIKL